MVIKHCSKCGRKMEFYCSEKFRLNGNNTKFDIWLIYKCSKCDSTWKLTIMQGVKPRDLPAGLLERFFNNDAELARKYAFDRSLLKGSECELNYANVGYTIEGFDPADMPLNSTAPLLVRLKSAYAFDLKLSVFLADVLGISISGVKRLAERGMLSASPGCDIMKYRIRADIDILLQPECWL
ncbi:MAG: DUF1062 domain-containing protein [Defluviitaleaceae bacterium]|nr:DUF1062 domain-containing protein [Defluviitaleaceae bacterium]